MGLTMMVANNYQYWSRSFKNMKIKTTEVPSYNNQISELNKRLSRLESILNGAPIADAKIASIKWNKAQGGTATLGGPDNGNGVMTIKDETGTEIVILDKNGVAINGGNLTIKNNDDVAILDAYGLVSGANFKSGSFQKTNYVNTILTASFADVTGETITTISLARDSKVFVTFNFTGWVTAGGVVDYDLNVDGAILTNSPFFIYHSSSVANSFSASGVLDLAAGTHTLKLQTRGTGTATTEYFSITYLVLGS